MSVHFSNKITHYFYPVQKEDAPNSGKRVNDSEDGETVDDGLSHKKKTYSIDPRGIPPLPERLAFDLLTNNAQQDPDERELALCPKKKPFLPNARVPKLRKLLL